MADHTARLRAALHIGLPEDPAARERVLAKRAARRARLHQLDVAVVVPVLLLILCLVLVAAGVGVVFGAGWAMIVTGAVAGVLSLFTGWR